MLSGKVTDVTAGGGPPESVMLRQKERYNAVLPAGATRR